MYGGLFGDLPPTKEQQQQQQHKAGDVSETPANAAPLDGRNNNESNDIAAKEALSKLKKEPPSLVGHLGTSGTAVAFIPAAARRKNLKRPATSLSSLTKSMKESHSTTAVGASLPKIATVSNANVKSSLSCPSEVSQRQQDHEIEKTESNLLDSTSVPLCTEDTLEDDDNQNEDMKEIYNATTAITDHHTHRSDRYDPFLPNDLLEYWERKAAEETWRAEAQAEQQLRRNREQAEQLRRQQQEREMHKPEEPPRGRGRGGLSNLPAWMVEQQRRQDALGSASHGQ
ncbi:hypothetical protein FisN_13Hh062 [Fistulifera solaris]|uniref:Uncharacterized protein n=1 Tax=Fistulifera solaris TaxID=1519565 RepID=A0A1Z5KP89_FISSO|nr:hypothetical protein FisN_13Hh062 [Fistulifera solaris]|eukprot:GAX27831.1 hypothetical protein FisN_13Hh062 [Fistulifera solaris]